MTEKDVAVVHGTALERGGGVHVAEELARTFDAPLYFGTCEDSVLDRVADDIECDVLFDGPVAARVRDRSSLRNLYYICRFQHVEELHSYDVVIQSDNGTEWYVPPEDQALVRYSHSLPALSYQDFPKHGGSFVNRWYGFVSRILRVPTISFPDEYLANSETTKRQLAHYWNVNAEIAYPPVQTNEFQQFERGDFYFTVSRLIEGKNVDTVVEVFTHRYPDKRLVVAGSGPEEGRLRCIAGENVEIRGWIDEAEKRHLLGSCKALVLNSGNESFGIVPVEAFASGTPVIGVDNGYTPYQITDGWNGMLYEPGNIASAVKRFENDGTSATRNEIEEFAERYSVEAFRQTVRKVVERAHSKLEITAP